MPALRNQEQQAFSISVRVYYEDTDAGGVVYYANYLKFLERCRTEWMRASGHDQSDLLRDPGIAFVVRSVNAEFLKPARLDDGLEVGLSVERIARSQIFFHQQIRRAAADGGSDVLIDARVQIVCVRADAMKPVSIPPALRHQLEALQ